jgi:hypothetical protein
VADLRQSPEDQKLLEQTIAVLGQWEPSHRRWMKRANHFYALYRNYQDLRGSLESTTSPRGKDAILSDAQGEFGRELFIPMAFSTVETIVPAMLSGDPRMVVKPRNLGSENNTPTIKGLIEAQQAQIKYPLKLQTIAKDGLVYGTGVQKTRWKKEYRVERRLMPSAGPGGMVEGQALHEKFDDPDADAVDPIDFIADPFSQDIDSSEGAFHRTWRSTRYVRRMVESQQWRNLDGFSTDQLDALADGRKYEEVWNERKTAGDPLNHGSSTTPVGSRGKAAVHEVLEYHDGDNVVTVLDRQVIVAAGPNPNWHGELPFQIYRPTEITHEFHGIGEIEPIEQLQEELNTLRTQRRYNADLVLQRTFAYADGHIDPDDIQFGPGFAIPTLGDPRELLFPIPVGDIPASGYEEEDRIGSDIDRTSGISDVIAGAGLSGGGDTATGVQLVQSAASRRIENKTKRLEMEIIGPGAQQFVSLSQQRILNNRTVRIPARPTPGEPDRRWAWLELGPEELMGEFDIECESGSTQPENIPQNRADAQMAMTLFGQNPAVDQHKVVAWSVGKLGVDHPQDWLAPPEPTVPAATLDRLVEAGVPKPLIVQALAAAGGPPLDGGNPTAAPTGEPQPPSEGPPPPEGGGNEPESHPEPTGAK